MKRSEQQEMMDLPGQPRELLEGNFADIRMINRYMGNYRSVIRGLSWLVQEQQLVDFSLLDIGTGSGDIPARISYWAQRRGLRARIVGLEAEPTTARLAAMQTRQENPPLIPRTCEQMCDPPLTSPPSRGREERGLLPRFLSTVIPAEAGIQWEKEEDLPRHGISVVRGNGCEPPFGPASFDFVLASQLLHHFSEDQIVSLLKTWSKVARKAIIVSDLVRHPAAYYGIRIITKLFTRNVMTQTDAPLSVRRAFTAAEWRDIFRRADVGPLRLFSVFPFRMLALISVRG
ncbi:MAG TPA: methyltransferase domain-containing protein [Candidatus Acidoferrales bacterium]|nr:methyltransferase domain-containing protein [Candidatus Acidoferrales bacterium]